MNQVSDGITRGDIGVGQAAARHAVEDAAKRFDWPATLDLLQHEPGLVNITKPLNAPLHAPLHQAAHGGGPAEVCK